MQLPLSSHILFFNRNTISPSMDEGWLNRPAVLPTYMAFDLIYQTTSSNVEENILAPWNSDSFDFSFETALPVKEENLPPTWNPNRYNPAYQANLLLGEEDIPPSWNPRSSDPTYQTNLLLGEEDIPPSWNPLSSDPTYQTNLSVGEQDHQPIWNPSSFDPTYQNELSVGEENILSSWIHLDWNTKESSQGHNTELSEFQEPEPKAAQSSTPEVSLKLGFTPLSKKEIKNRERACKGCNERREKCKDVRICCQRRNDYCEKWGEISPGQSTNSSIYSPRAVSNLQRKRSNGLKKRERKSRCKRACTHCRKARVKCQVEAETVQHTQRDGPRKACNACSKKDISCDWSMKQQRE